MRPGESNKQCQIYFCSLKYFVVFSQAGFKLYLSKGFRQAFFKQSEPKILCLVFSNLIFAGRDKEEGVAALQRPDGRQCGQDPRGEHSQGVRGAVMCSDWSTVRMKASYWSLLWSPHPLVSSQWASSTLDAIILTPFFNPLFENLMKVETIETILMKNLHLIKQ